MRDERYEDANGFNSEPPSASGGVHDGIGATSVRSSSISSHFDPWPKSSLEKRDEKSYSERMITLSQTPTNQRKTAQLVASLKEMLSETLRQGFHGKVGVELSIQDGTIQQICRRVERIER